MVMGEQLNAAIEEAVREAISASAPLAVPFVDPLVPGQMYWNVSNSQVNVSLGPPPVGVFNFLWPLSGAPDYTGPIATVIFADTATLLSNITTSSYFIGVSGGGALTLTIAQSAPGVFVVSGTFPATESTEFFLQVGNSVTGLGITMQMQPPTMPSGNSTLSTLSPGVDYVGPLATFIFADTGVTAAGLVYSASVAGFPDLAVSLATNSTPGQFVMSGTIPFDQMTSASIVLTCTVGYLNYPSLVRALVTSVAIPGFPVYLNVNQFPVVGGPGFTTNMDGSITGTIGEWAFTDQTLTEADIAFSANMDGFPPFVTTIAFVHDRFNGQVVHLTGTIPAEQLGAASETMTVTQIGTPYTMTVNITSAGVESQS